jgi:RES domain-containing protein
MTLAGATRIRRRCWRVLAPRWAHDPLSGAGAARNGGRFNEPGVPALYLSEDLLTAIAEYEQELGIRPGTFCAYKVDVEEVVDLTDAAACRELRIRAADLRCAWKTMILAERRQPPSWKIAARLLRAGYAGARVPSMQNPAGVNLVLWRWNDAPNHRVLPQDPQRDLPRHQRSWS